MRFSATRIQLLAVAGAAILMVWVLTGCGGGSSSSSGSSTATSGGTTGSSAAVDPKLAELLPADIRDSGTLTVATNAEYPPCESFESASDSTMIGFEPDLWNAMGAKLGVKVNAINTSFDGLIPGVQAGRYPLAMECISDSPEREEQVTFVDFVYAEDAIFTLEENPAEITSDPLSLCGLTAAAQSGTDIVPVVTETLTPHCTKNGKPPVKLNQYPAQSQVLLSLYSGRSDFVVTDLAAAAALKESAPKPITIIQDSLLPKFYLGVVVNKDEKELQQTVLATMKALVADGTYEKVLKKWGISALSLPNPGINLATKHPIPNPEP
jgi:polar amino acid transport system substrate-binding protein